MTVQDKKARIAGALYLVVVVSGIFSLAYVPSQLIVWNNAALTVSNLREFEMLYRLGIVAGVICYTAFLLLPLALYRLLHPVDKTYAVVMISLAVVSVPFSLFNLTHKVNVLTLLQMGNVVMDPVSLQNEVLTVLNYYNNGIKLVSVFWGLWLFPFGYLVYRSGFLPKILGVFLMLGCFGYLINTIGGFLYRDYSDLGIAGWVSIPASLGEIGICLWLLAFGARKGFRS